MDEHMKRVKGNEEIERLYLENRLSLIRYVTVVIDNKDMAEDIVQEAFCEALNKREIILTHANPRKWLYVAAAYKIKEMRRKNILCEDIEGTEIPMEEEGFWRVEAEMMLSNVLTNEERKLFRRYHLWGLSMEEIAEKEKISENNLRVKLSRLKQKIVNTIMKRD